MTSFTVAGERCTDCFATEQACAARVFCCVMCSHRFGEATDEAKPLPALVPWACHCAVVGESATAIDSARAWLRHARAKGCTSITLLALEAALNLMPPASP